MSTLMSHNSRCTGKLQVWLDRCRRASTDLGYLKHNVTPEAGAHDTSKSCSKQTAVKLAKASTQPQCG